MRGDSLEGYTKRSGRNRGRSPRVVVRIQLPGRQYLVTLLHLSWWRGTVLQTVATVFIPPGLRPGLRTLRLVQPYRLVEAWDVQHRHYGILFKQQHRQRDYFCNRKVVVVVIVDIVSVVFVVSVVVKTKARQLQTWTSELGYSILGTSNCKP